MSHLHESEVDHIPERPRCAGGWTALAEEWWKKGAEALKPTNIMELPFWRSTWGELLESTNGKFYVREEYPALYERLEEACTLQSGRRVELGVVVTGQPGIGKSIFGVYTLLRRLAAGQPVIYYYHPNVIYFRSGSAVNLVLSDLENYPTPDTTWTLIEPRSDHNLIHTSLIDSLLFTVAFIPPHEPGLKQLVTKAQLTRWIMPLWTNNELVELLSHGLFPDVVRDAVTGIDGVRSQVQHLVAEAGPCPRDIILWAKDPRLFAERIEEAANAIDGFEPLCDPTCWPTTTSDAILIIDRPKCSQLGVRRTASDAFSVQIKSHPARMALMRRAMNVNLEKATDFFYIPVGQTRQIAGIIFEGLALRCISGNVPLSSFNSMVGMFAQMARETATTRSTEFAHAFEYSPHNPSHTLVIDGQEVQLKRLDGTVQTGCGARMASPFPLPKHIPPASASRVQDVPPGREHVIYNDVEGIQVQGDFCSKFYIPRLHNNPLFDALCFSRTDTGDIVLWLFQVTIAKKHTGSSSGFQLLSDLVERTKAAHATSAVNVNLVLVVPSHQRWQVQLALASEYTTIVDEVFIQFINVVEHARHCWPDQVVTAGD